MFARVIVAMTGAAIQDRRPQYMGKQHKTWHFDRMAAEIGFGISRCS